MNLNGLQKHFKTKYGEIDFTEVNEYGETPLMYALGNNIGDGLNLNNEQLNYLIKKSDLKKFDDKGWSPLIFALLSNKSEELNLNEDQWDYLIKNSNLKNIDRDFGIPLMYALIFKKDENLNLSKEQWKYFINNSNLSLISGKEELIELKKIQSELLNEKILNKIDIKEDLYKNNKI